MQPRYQCFTHGDGWYWRLLGANNRVLARCPDPFPDADAAARDATAVAQLAPHGRLELVADAGAAWRWMLVERSTVRAVSAVPYARRMECVRAAGRFRLSAATAELSSERMTFPARPPAAAAVAVAPVGPTAGPPPGTPAEPAAESIV